MTKLFMHRHNHQPSSPSYNGNVFVKLIISHHHPRATALCLQCPSWNLMGHSSRQNLSRRNPMELSHFTKMLTHRMFRGQSRSLWKLSGQPQTGFLASSPLDLCKTHPRLPWQSKSSSGSLSPRSME